MRDVAPRIGSGLPSDEDVVRRVRAGEVALFEVLMRRYNQRVYRAVRGFLRDEAEVEDVMQQAYLQAYSNLKSFEGTARFSTWLLRIAVNEALMRLRKSARLRVVDEPSELEELPMTTPGPEERAERRELAALLEQAVDALPELYRSAFLLREVEGLSTAETAEVLGVREDVVKTRLHRAKGLVRDSLFERVGVGSAETFPFMGARCDRVVALVMGRIRA